MISKCGRYNEKSIALLWDYYIINFRKLFLIVKLCVKFSSNIRVQRYVRSTFYLIAGKPERLGILFRIKHRDSYQARKYILDI